MPPTILWLNFDYKLADFLLSVRNSHLALTSYVENRCSLSFSKGISCSASVCSCISIGNIPQK